MNWIIKIFILLVFTFSVSDSHAQFWKKKGRHVRTASNGIAKKKQKSSSKSPFNAKSKKGANQKTTRKPLWRSKKNMRSHALGRKSKNKANKNFHKQRMLKRSLVKTSSSSSKGERRSRKSSQKGNGASRGRKK